MKNNLPLSQCTKRDSNYKWVEKKCITQIDLTSYLFFLFVLHLKKDERFFSENVKL